jgi:GNAT superfamily N-acetyltransferase
VWAHKKYSVREEGAEVGYVALDWYPLDACTDLILYEMFVPEKFRHRGVGSRILAATEELAGARGYSRVLLIARPLEDYPKGKLIEWYQERGFGAVPHACENAMAKNVS